VSISHVVIFLFDESETSQSYWKKQRVMDELARLAVLVKHSFAQAASVVQARADLDAHVTTTATRADEAVQALCKGIIDQIKQFRNKYEKLPYSRSIASAVDALTPPLQHITLQPPEDHFRAALSSLSQQNTQLRTELRNNATEMTAMRDTCRELNARLAQQQIDTRLIRQLQEELKKKDDELRKYRQRTLERL